MFWCIGIYIVTFVTLKVLKSYRYLQTFQSNTNSTFLWECQTRNNKNKIEANKNWGIDELKLWLLFEKVWEKFKTDSSQANYLILKNDTIYNNFEIWYVDRTNINILESLAVNCH